jgi:hypothetical protein
MKRFIYTIIAGAMLVLAADNAEAQKPRNVYLWDVTASMDKLGIRQTVEDYLINDIKRIKRSSNTEVVIIPFQDSALTSKIMQYTISDKTDFDAMSRSIRSEGRAMVKAHNVRGAYTDIARPLKYVSKNWLSSNYNTKIVLLTDGVQEIDEQWNKADNPATPEAREFLRQTILEMDKLLGVDSIRSETHNFLYYVMTHEKAVSPLNPTDSLKNVGCLSPDDFPLNPSIIEITPQAILEMTTRETSCSMPFKMLQEYSEDMPEVKIRLQGSNSDGSVVIDQVVSLNLKNQLVDVRPILSDRRNLTDCNFDLSVEIEDADMLKNEGYIVRLTKNIVQFQITQAIRPHLTITLVD